MMGGEKRHERQIERIRGGKADRKDTLEIERQLERIRSFIHLFDVLGCE